MVHSIAYLLPKLPWLWVITMYYLLRNGLAAGGFSNASVAFTGGLIIELETFKYLMF